MNSTVLSTLSVSSPVRHTIADLINGDQSGGTAVSAHCAASVFEIGFDSSNVYKLRHMDRTA
jgi:hypothetical protein